MATPDSNIINMINADVYLDDSDGTQHNISGSSAQIQFQFDHRLGTYQTFADDWDRTLPGPRGGTGTLTLLYTPTANEGFDLVRDWYLESFTERDPRTLRCDGSTEIGYVQVIGEIQLNSFSFTGDANQGQPVQVSVSFTFHGAISIGTSTT